MKNIIDDIKNAVDVETDSELAEELSIVAKKKIAKQRIFHWRHDGFFGSTEALIRLLLKKIKELS